MEYIQNLFDPEYSGGPIWKYFCLKDWVCQQIKADPEHEGYRPSSEIREFIDGEYILERNDDNEV